jgi:hypothetical protein
MDVKGFALQYNNHKTYSDKENIAVITYCATNDMIYRSFSKNSDIPEGFIPVGSVEYCEKFLPKEKTIPNYYPDFLKDKLYRKVWYTEKWPLGEKVFIKPADKHKRFTGFITSGGYRKKKKKPYWCSTIVKFINEWRYYVADGEILTGEWYDGDEINTPDAPKLDIKIPSKYCGALDFGMLETGEIALVEANFPYACGWYGKDHKKYVEWLIKGWKYMLSL